QVLDIILDDPEALLTTPLADTVWRASAENSGTRARGSDGERTQSTIDQRILAAWVVDIDRGTFPQGLSQVITRSVRELITVGFDTIVGESDGVVLFALGSFAVGEPRLTSDLDLLVITKGRELEPVTRAIQGISRILAEGNLLQIDFRLRGEGANAPLVQDLETYRQYFAKRLSPWERVAFAKCAHWWGDPSLAEEFTEAIMPRLVENPVPGTIESLIETRSKLQGLVKKDAELLETKRSQGGRYDIEYLCSIGLAVLGKPFSLEHSSRTRLKHLAKAGLITSDDHDTMTAALALYSKIEYLLELGELMLPSSPESTTETFQYLATTMELLGMSSNGDVESALGQYKELVRRCYDNFVSQLH
ncbi:MAG: hypothetical protein OEN01_00800, partial [Candidatus Krumholzibacteria bacterium]|nr:hypothetical protein [Candidatus Krumholzibacteria bacterium]